MANVASHVFWRTEISSNTLLLSNRLVLTFMSKIIFLLLIFMPLADFFSVYSRSIGFSAGERFSLLYRLILILFCVFLFLRESFQHKMHIIILFYVSLLSLTINYFIIDGSDLSRFVESAIILVKFYVFFIFFGAFTFAIKTNLISPSNCIRIINFLILVYCTMILIGAFFDVELFQNYISDDAERWGVKGIIIAGNEASGFLTIALAWTLLNKKNSLFYFQFFTVITSSIVSGTKAALISSFLVVACYYFAKYKAKALIYLFFYTAISFMVFYISYVSFSSFSEAVDQSVHYFIWHYENNQTGSILNVALTGRDYKLSVVFSDVFYDAPWIFFTGGFPIGNYTIEMDFFDAVALSGFIGASLYFYYWVRTWGSFTSCSADLFKMYFCITFFILGFLGGHYYYSAMSAPFLAFLCVRMNSLKLYSYD